jgi:hypothetical protein
VAGVRTLIKALDSVKLSHVDNTNFFVIKGTVLETKPRHIRSRKMNESVTYKTRKAQSGSLFCPRIWMYLRRTVQ